MQNYFIHKLHSKNAGMLCKQKQNAMIVIY